MDVRQGSILSPEGRHKRKYDEDVKKADSTNEAVLTYSVLKEVPPGEEAEEAFGFDGDVLLLGYDAAATGPLRGVLRRMKEDKIVSDKEASITLVELTLTTPKGSTSFPTAAVSLGQSCDLETTNESNKRRRMEELEVLAMFTPEGDEALTSDLQQVLEKHKGVPEQYAKCCSKLGVFLFVPATVLTFLGEDTAKTFPVKEGDGVSFTEERIGCKQSVTALNFGENRLLLTGSEEDECGITWFL